MSLSDRRDFIMTSLGSAAALALTPTLEARPWTPAESIGVGVVGAGRQGRAILGELATFDAARIVGVCDTDERRLRSGLRRVKGAAGFASHGEMLAKAEGLDAVVVATPTHLHREVVEAALAAGKHVYCEAPLAHTLEDARAIAAAARGADGVFQSGYQARANPIYGLARSFVRSGTLRDMVNVRASYAKKTSWRTEGSSPERDRQLNWHLDPEVSLGMAGELGSHQLDAVHWFLDRYPVAVSGSGSIRLHADGRAMPDTIQVDLEFEDGLRMAYQATLASSFEGRYELFTGSMASIKLSWTAGWMFKEADSPTQGWEVYANRQSFHTDEGITLIADATKLAAQGKLKEGVGLPNTPLWYALEAFLKSALEDRPVVCTADEGLRTTAVAIHAARAVASGERVAIDPKTLGGE